MVKRRNIKKSRFGAPMSSEEYEEELKKIKNKLDNEFYETASDGNLKLKKGKTHSDYVKRYMEDKAKLSKPLGKGLRQKKTAGPSGEEILSLQPKALIIFNMYKDREDVKKLIDEYNREKNFAKFDSIVKYIYDNYRKPGIQPGIKLDPNPELYALISNVVSYMLLQNRPPEESEKILQKAKTKFLYDLSSVEIDSETGKKKYKKTGVGKAILDYYKTHETDLFSIKKCEDFLKKVNAKFEKSALPIDSATRKFVKKCIEMNKELKTTYAIVGSAVKRILDSKDTAFTDVIERKVKDLRDTYIITWKDINKEYDNNPASITFDAIKPNIFIEGGMYPVSTGKEEEINDFFNKNPGSVDILIKQYIEPFYPYLTGEKQSEKAKILLSKGFVLLKGFYEHVGEEADAAMTNIQRVWSHLCESHQAFQNFDNRIKASLKEKVHPGEKEPDCNAYLQAARGLGPFAALYQPIIKKAWEESGKNIKEFYKKLGCDCTKKENEPLIGFIAQSLKEEDKKALMAQYAKDCMPDPGHKTPPPHPCQELFREIISLNSTNNEGFKQLKGKFDKKDFKYKQDCCIFFKKSLEEMKKTSGSDDIVASLERFLKENCDITPKKREPVKPHEIKCHNIARKLRSIDRKLKLGEKLEELTTEENAIWKSYEKAITTGDGSEFINNYVGVDIDDKEHSATWKECACSDADYIISKVLKVSSVKNTKLAKKYYEKCPPPKPYSYWDRKANPDPNCGHLITQLMSIKGNDKSKKRQRGIIIGRIIRNCCGDDSLKDKKFVSSDYHRIVLLGCCRDKIRRYLELFNNGKVPSKQDIDRLNISKECCNSKYLSKENFEKALLCKNHCKIALTEYLKLKDNRDPHSNTRKRDIEEKYFLNPECCKVIIKMPEFHRLPQRVQQEMKRVCGEPEEHRIRRYHHVTTRNSCESKLKPHLDEINRIRRSGDKSRLVHYLQRFRDCCSDQYFIDLLDNLGVDVDTVCPPQSHHITQRHHIPSVVSRSPDQIIQGPQQFISSPRYTPPPIGYRYTNQQMPRYYMQIPFYRVPWYTQNYSVPYLTMRETGPPPPLYIGTVPSDHTYTKVLRQVQQELKPELRPELRPELKQEDLKLLEKPPEVIYPQEGPCSGTCSPGKSCTCVPDTIEDGYVPKLSENCCENRVYDWSQGIFIAEDLVYIAAMVDETSGLFTFFSNGIKYDLPVIDEKALEIAREIYDKNVCTESNRLPNGKPLKNSIYCKSESVKTKICYEALCKFPFKLILEFMKCFGTLLQYIIKNNEAGANKYLECMTLEQFRTEQMIPFESRLNVDLKNLYDSMTNGSKRDQEMVAYITKLRGLSLQFSSIRKDKIKKLYYGKHFISFGNPVPIRTALRKLDTRLKNQQKERYYSGIQKISNGVYRMTKTSWKKVGTKNANKRVQNKQIANKRNSSRRKFKKT